MDPWKLITIGVILLYAIFLLYPVGKLLLQAFVDKTSGDITFNYFIKFFSQSYYFDTLMNSFKVSLCATALALAVGTPLAYLFTMYRVKGKKVLQVLIIIASMSAPFIGAYAWILLLGRNGVITNFFNQTVGFQTPDIYGFGGILLVFTLQLFPLVFLYVQGALRNVDNSLIEASENMGCTGAKRFFKVIIPLIMPMLLAAMLLVFMRALADFGTPMLIGEGYRTFPVLIFTEFLGEVSGDDGFAAAIAIIAVLITTIVFLVQKWVANRKSFSMNSLHPIEEKNFQNKRTSIVSYIFCYGVVGLAILPQAYVIYTSFLNTRGKIFVEGYSFESYRTAFSRLGNSIQNTILIPGIALVLIILLAVLISYLTVRRKNPATGTIDVISMVPYIIPGTVLGIALLTAFNTGIMGSGILAIGGTIGIMIVALVIRRLPYTIRSSTATLQQIPMSIEEAALSLGCSKMKTFFKITVPMMANGIIAGAILSWVTMISELSTAVLLYTVKTQTLTVSIYQQVVRGNYGVAAALAAILTTLTVISLLIFMKISKSDNVTI
ncbi:iron ABC transporter permease [Erysipelotrichaceae bacterium MTC7]|nr:iron ABC transporter permease [Erysipelotrichaceae bacterium MTC7]